MLEQATVGVSDDCDGLPVYNEFYYIGLSGMTDEKRYKKTYLPINQDIADGTSCQVTIALNDTANEGSYTKLVYTDTLSGIIDPTQTGTFTFPAFADTTPGSGVVAFPLLIHVEDWVISEIEVIEGSTITVSDLAYLDMKFEVVTPDPIG
jgi:hypothetical protein